MKTSEQLKLQSQQEDNDLKSYSFLIKSLRETKSEKFIEGWLEPLNLRYPITISNNSTKYTIETQDFGIIAYFPKANKLLIRKDNKWLKPGLK